MTTQEIKGKLSEIVEPAFEKKLGVLRMIGHVDADGDTASVEIKLPTHAYPQGFREQLKSSISEACKSSGKTANVSFTVETAFAPPPSEKHLLKGPKHVIAVAAGKGGVGKSTVATNLALALKNHGASVGLLDADIFGPSLPQMLGPAERPAGTQGDNQLTPSIHHGIKVISVGFFVDQEEAVVWRGPMVHRLLQQFLGDVVWGELDYLICDLPPGTGDVQISLSQLIPISGAVMVTTPQQVSIIDVVKGITMFEKVEIPVIGVVENMSYYECPACGHHDEIFSHGGGKRLAKEINLPFLGELPIDSRIRFGGDAGIPIVAASPDSETAERFSRLASKVALSLARPIVTAPKKGPRLAVIR